MNTLEMKMDAVIRLLTAEDSGAHDAAMDELRQLKESKATEVTPPNTVAEIRQILTVLGMPEHIVGHRYTIEAIRLVLENEKYLFMITTQLYPAVAEKFGTTKIRVERGIRHGIEIIWNRGDFDVLQEYFGNTVDPSKGKPTNSEFIARIAGIVRQRMEEAA